MAKNVKFYILRAIFGVSRNIALFFNCMLVHGIAPDELLLGTMIPLIKDTRGQKQCSDNYRALTIGTGLAKILDIVILNQQKNKLSTSNLQFGFK